MTVLEMKAEPENLTLTVIAEFDAPVEQLWAAWTDPDLLAQWLGTPGSPAEVSEFDLRPDGVVRYRHDGPDGATRSGVWRVVAVEPPRRVIVEDSFADETGQADLGVPTVTMEVGLRVANSDTVGPDRTVMTVTNRFPSRDAMDALIDAGQPSGMAGAMAQIEAVLEQQT